MQVKNCLLQLIHEKSFDTKSREMNNWLTRHRPFPLFYVYKILDFLSSWQVSVATHFPALHQLPCKTATLCLRSWNNKTHQINVVFHETQIISSFPILGKCNLSESDETKAITSRQIACKTQLVKIASMYWILDNKKIYDSQFARISLKYLAEQLLEARRI